MYMYCVLLCITVYYCVYKNKKITMYCVARHLQCTVCSFLFVHVYVLCTFRLTVYMKEYKYGVATISRLLKMIGLFCRIQSLL